MVLEYIPRGCRSSVMFLTTYVVILSFHLNLIGLTVRITPVDFYLCRQNLSVWFKYHVLLDTFQDRLVIYILSIERIIPFKHVNWTMCNLHQILLIKRYRRTPNTKVRNYRTN